MISIPFDNRYLQLGEKYAQPVEPEPVKQPGLIAFNESLAASLGIEFSTAGEQELAEVFAGNRIPDGAVPLAMAYAGHQFGHFVPQLGDGRAVLLGEIHAADGRWLSVQLKGSGWTPFSRNGDGRAALGPVLREYLLSEAMAALGIPTTRALAAVSTGEKVVREQLLPGAVITRVAEGFIRVGTFQYFIARSDLEGVRQLADHVIAHYYPGLVDAQNPYAALLESVMEAQASLIARWMLVGFIHGVMNTDNMSVTGETIDYGPCAFMDSYRHDQVYSSIDQVGRYAYANQPAVGLWNLSRFAETLLPLLAEDPEPAMTLAKDILGTFMDRFQQHRLDGMRAKCGLSAAVETQAAAGDRALVEELLTIMEHNAADFTLTFHYLSRLSSQSDERDRELNALFSTPAELDAWLEKWRARLRHETRSEELRQAAMATVNPRYIPRNHQIEAAIRAAEDKGDFSVFESLHRVLQSPYTFQPGCDDYQQPPEPHQEVRQTFCGT